MRDPAQQAAHSANEKRKNSRRFHICFDEPADWSKRVRWLRLTGWCVAPGGEPLTAIRAQIARDAFPGSFDRDRPDVPEHLGMPTAPTRCGFTVEVKVPPGKNNLEIQVAGVDGRWRKAFTCTIHGPWFVTAARRKRELDLANARARYEFCFDRPSDWNTPASTLYISGWCVDRSGAWIDGIRARIGSRFHQGNFGFKRPDVAESHPRCAPALRSGFAIALRPPVGKSTLVLEVKTANGDWRAFFDHEIHGRPDSSESKPPSDEESALFIPRMQPPGFELWFDQPIDWDNVVGRDLYVAGWCVPTRGTPICEMRARVGNKTYPVKHGLLRPDIALAFEGETNALASGFAANLEMPHGRSIFVLEGRLENSAWTQLFRRQIRGSFFANRSRGRLESVGDYSAWVRSYDTLSSGDRKKIALHIARFERHPRFSILLPVHNPPPRLLRSAIDSLRNQLYPEWELCIVDDASTNPGVWKLVQAFARRDKRIRVVRRQEHGHICATSNDALDMATGEFVVLLDQDDELAPTALYFAAFALNQNPRLQLLYSDEDKLDRHGHRCQPHFKSDWNPDLLTGQNYISHLGVYRTELARAVGGFRVGFEGAQDYDLVLRCIERIEEDQIAHLPRVLYHWRMAEESTAAIPHAKPYALDAAARAMREHLARKQITATVEPHRDIYLRVKYPVPSNEPLVSMIVPTRDRVELLQQLIESVFAKTQYQTFELLIIDNGSSEPATLEYLESLKENRRVLIHPVPGPFNYSRLNNIGVSKARGTVIALMNNDLEVINPNWLSEMLGQLMRPKIGAVGARLWYPDGALQHGGVILGSGGVAGHIHGGKREEPGYFSRQYLTQNLSAVTAACMLVRKETYQELNGFDETSLPVAFDDVDFCLRLGRAGYRVVWTPHAELVHHESASRGIEDTSDKQRRFLSEIRYMEETWGEQLLNDPYYNPNLSLSLDLFTLAFPPRVTKPWETA